MSRRPFDDLLKDPFGGPLPALPRDPRDKYPRVDLGNFEIKHVAVSVEEHRLDEYDVGMVGVNVCLQPGRDSHNPSKPAGEILLRRVCRRELLEDSGAFEHFVRRVVREAVLHELDEWLRIDGKLVHDPHSDDASKL